MKQLLDPVCLGLFLSTALAVWFASSKSLGKTYHGRYKAMCRVGYSIICGGLVTLLSRLEALSMMSRAILLYITIIGFLMVSIGVALTKWSRSVVADTDLSPVEEVAHSRERFRAALLIGWVIFFAFFVWFFVFRKK